jgi:multiple sugar transport system substrate-binding protein
MKKNTAKRVTASVLAGAMALSLAACGSGSASSTATSTSASSTAQASGDTAAANPADISGTITVGGWPSGDDGFKAALAGFNEKYPNINVEFNFTDTTSHHQALATALAAGTGAPDVAMVEGAYIAQYRDSTALTNLKDAPYNADQYKDDFVALKWNQAYSVDGSRLVAVPWDVGPCVYYYRSDVFEECGLPTDPDEVASLMSTWDGVEKVAAAVSKPGERWLLPNAAYLYQLLFCNRDYYDQDLNLKLERDGDLDCLNTVIDMRKNGWDMNVDMWSTEAYAAYAAGTCVSVATGCWFGGFLKTDIDPDGAGHWKVTTLPGGIADCNWGGSYLVIPEQSQNKEAAWAFVEYMLCNATAQNQMLDAVDYFPAYTPAYNDPTYEEADAYFGGEKTKALYAKIADKLKDTSVFNTMMDVTAEGCIYSTVNAGLDAGSTAEQIRTQLGTDIEDATAELKQQQIQVYKDAGLWNK